MNWTTEYVLSLAPDPSSAKAGRDLSQPRKWVSFARNEAALWGECQGSGKLPYQTQIDLSGPTFKCTCPSRNLCVEDIEKAPAALLQNEHKRVRAAAITALGRKGNEFAVKPLQQALDDEAPAVSGKADHALAKVEKRVKREAR
ncbi:MAG: hypothetical protein C4331_10775 [Meiothermus sp.]